jgi:hypothetical protein
VGSIPGSRRALTNMETLINWFNNLSKNVKIAIIVAVAIFTPVLGIVFGVVFGVLSVIFNVLGFVLGFVNWGIAFLLLMAFAGYKGYTFLKSNEEEEVVEEDSSWDPFR